MWSRQRGSRRIWLTATPRVSHQAALQSIHQGRPDVPPDACRNYLPMSGDIHALLSTIRRTDRPVFAIRDPVSG
jgi:hypothetical protein